MEGVCPLCVGSGNLRHERPEEISDQVWAGYVGNPPRCPLCQGLGKERFVTVANKTHRVEFFPIRTWKGTVIAACSFPGCTKWLDITNMVGMGKGQRLITDFDSRCPNGHRMEMRLTFPGGRQVSKGIEARN